MYSFITKPYDTAMHPHTLQSCAASFNFQHPLVCLRSSSSCLRLLPLSPIISVLPSIFPSITCCRRQFLHNKCPIQLAFHLFTVCRVFLSSLILCNTFPFFSSTHSYYVDILILSRLARWWLAVTSCFSTVLNSSGLNSYHKSCF